jgi:hydroxymethylpyrimidine pyrophosphatase-like HAD family hydrolase
LYVTRSQATYIEFTDASVSKSGALAWLCGRLGVAREQVVALGDGMNDVDMLAWAGLGVAVAEAAPPVRAAADIVVRRAAVPAFLDSLDGPASIQK